MTNQTIKLGAGLRQVKKSAVVKWGRLFRLRFRD
jgi:hypothetical protein